MPRLEEIRSHPSAASRALARILSDGRFTTKDVAEVANCSDRQVQKVANQQAYFGQEAAEKVARWFSDQNETRYSEAYFGTGWRHQRKMEGECNDTVADDVAEISRHIGHIMDCEDDLDKDRARNAIRAIRKELRDCEAEIEGW